MRMRQYTEERLTREDLVVLRSYSLEELERFLCIGGGKYAVYRERLLAICLCQEAARNYVSGEGRLNDLDVWFFFREHDTVKLPNLRNLWKPLDGMFPAIGRKRIDFMKKAIPLAFAVEEDIPQTIRDFLVKRGTLNSEKLRAKPVVGLFPEPIFDAVLWMPPSVHEREASFKA